MTTDDFAALPPAERGAIVDALLACVERVESDDLFGEMLGRALLFHEMDAVLSRREHET